MAYLNGKKILMGSNVTIANLSVDQDYNPESENAQSGKAVAQAVANLGGTDEKYQLIETITTTEDVNSIKRAKEPSGANYKFKKLYLILEVKTATGTSGLNIRMNERVMGTLNNAISSSWDAKSIIKFEVFQGVNIVESVRRQHTNDFPNNAVNSSTSCSPGISSINSFELYNNSVAIPTGSIVKIYGVRA